uniref:WSC domain-containing protein n=1 Tax=Kwoniella dejecticola CBS 10117 TaxID=1296121 RepID=A0A1A6A275_9TREE|nr:uncharacterized protein I303_04986 [Kwoniella dejecticola CBS 10117]OBR84129.1 hypothetical protein I303_04986 [Kwoniella dejecticola CBS 10117]
MFALPFSLVWSILLLCRFCSLNLVGAQNQFAGCFVQGPDSGGDDVLIFFEDIIHDADICAAKCAGWNYAWIGYGFLCYCSTGFVEPFRMISGGEDTCISSGWTEGRIVSTSFAFNRCGSSSDSNTPRLGVQSPKECFENCKNDLYAAFKIDDTSSSGYSCWCPTNLDNVMGSTCGQGGTFYYSHPAAAAASGLSRRNARLEALERRKQISMQTCPWGLTACLIPDLQSSDAWECVDTSTELESCGGCIHGTYDNQNAKQGQR